MTEPRAFPYQGRARTFRWYELADDASFKCQCGWTGKVDDCASEVFHELIQGDCPECESMLYVRAFPTFAETREAAALGDTRAIRQLASSEHAE